MIKRLFDIILPLGIYSCFQYFIIISILIKIDLWSCFFLQERVGLNGKLFKIIKFRSMKEDHKNSLSVTQNDKRITRIGKKLRKYKIDEIPN